MLASGRRIGVAEFGAADGYPVLACHGAPASRLMFEVADEDARRLGIRLIAFDRPGYGNSPLDYGTTLAGRTAAFAEIPDALKIDRFALLGISGGAPYAVALAARLGRRVSALGLVSPLGPVFDLGSRSAPEPVELTTAQRAFFLDLPGHPWLLRSNAEIAMRAFRLAPRMFAGAFAHFLPEADRIIVSQPQVVDSLVSMTLDATRHGISGGVTDLEIYGASWEVDYTGITCPSRLWQGLEDSIVPPEAALKLGELIPGCETVRIDGAGHFWIYDNVGPTLSALIGLVGAI
ncbi:MAG: alpha/beta fold hydrolase [Hyphomicrobiaceae bacterium]